MKWRLQGEQDWNRLRGSERTFEQKSKLKEAASLIGEVGSPE